MNVEIPIYSTSVYYKMGIFKDVSEVAETEKNLEARRKGDTNS